jgi:hypothetical protein
VIDSLLNEDDPMFTIANAVWLIAAGFVAAGSMRQE